MTEFFIDEDFPCNQVEFEERFNTEQACRDYLANMKWPDGFQCRNCGHNQYWISAKGLYICTRCEAPNSLTAGTVMHGTKKPLTYWFKAMWWFTTRKSGVNAINLKDLLGLGSYQTAWLWLHKLRRCTIRNGREQLSGTVEVDEFVIGGQHPGKRGRGANGKTIVVAAVEKKGKKLGRIRLQVVPDCSANILEQSVKANVTPGSTVKTDGWIGYNFLDESSYIHDQVVASHIAEKESVLPGVHLIASLVKRLIIGTFQGRFDPKHLQSYLDEYVFRFNRRTSRNIGKKFMRIAQQVTASTITTYEQIKAGDSRFSLLAN
jgi:transposase-like protein/DNA-directed RNA polymerase subunit RPC12/RpoP